MKRILKYVSVLLVCMMMFLTTGCKLTMYYTYNGHFFVAPIVQEGQIREGHYEQAVIDAFERNFIADEAYFTDLADNVRQKAGDDKEGYATLQARIRDCLSVSLVNETYKHDLGTTKQAAVIVTIFVPWDEAFRDVLKEAVKEESKEYIVKHLDYPDDCIGTHCELNQESWDKKLNIDLGF